MDRRGAGQLCNSICAHMPIWRLVEPAALRVSRGALVGKVSMSGSLEKRTFSALQLPLRLWAHLALSRKRQFILLTLLMLASALAEAFSLGAIIPFLAVLADPEHVLRHPSGAELAKFLEITHAQQLVLPLALIFASAAIFSAAIRVLQLWANTRFSYAIGGDFSVDCFHKTLHQPYETHLSRNSSLVLSTIAKKVGVAVAVLYQLITVLSSVVVLVAVVIALMLVDWEIAILAGGSFTALYLFIIFAAKRTLIFNSLWSAKQEDKSIQILQEGLGGIRDILLDGTQSSYSNKYAGVVYPLRKVQATNVTLAGSPRYLMEAIGLCIVTALACSSILGEDKAEFANLLPILGAFALGAQRLLPTLQQIYSAWAGIVGNYGAVVNVIEMLDQRIPVVDRQVNAAHMIALCPRRSISLNRIHFRYGPNSPWVFHGLNLQIEKGSHLGIIGTTGSGKSTALDLLMALIKPTEGDLRVDDTVIDENNKRAWQKCIAHVPQSIFLTDASIAENIAFEVQKKHIDMERVRQAAQQAKIADFIAAHPDGYQAMVGERGVSLSGGQLQRIGIARALYKQAPVLILDEATSALDNETEAAVLETIDQLDRNLTVIVVAHRLSTLKACNRIVELADGQIKLYASYDDLVRAKDNDIINLYGEKA